MCSSTSYKEAEANLIKEIEKYRHLQKHERRRINQHRTQELFHLDRERQLYDELKKTQEERRNREKAMKEQQLRRAIDIREMALAEQVKQRLMESTAFEEREIELVTEIERRLTELRTKEKSLEQERQEFQRREKELLTLNKKREAKCIELKQRHTEIIEQLNLRETEVREKELLTEAEREELQRKESELTEELNFRIADLRKREQLGEEERQLLKAREQELLILCQLNFAEKFDLEREQEEWARKWSDRLKGIRRMEELTEQQRVKLAHKERDNEIEFERTLEEWKQTNNTPVVEPKELKRREQELIKINEERENERIKFESFEKRLMENIAAKEAELAENEKINQQKRAEIALIQEEFEKTSLQIEQQLTDLEARKVSLTEETKRREEEINEKQILTESKRKMLDQKENDSLADIQKKEEELKAKLEMIEAEKTEVLKIEQEVARLNSLREVELQRRNDQLKKHREYEAHLLAQNQALIQGIANMQKEITRMEDELYNLSQFSYFPLKTNTSMQLETSSV